MNSETGLSPAPDAASRTMQGRAYTPFVSWSHEQLGQNIRVGAGAAGKSPDNNSKAL
jgi:hypothetical protein